MLIAGPARALDQVPIARFDAAGGQVFFKDYAGTSKTPAGTAAASADWLFADGLKLSDDDALIPAISGQYMRRDQVNQIGGGGTLVSQTLDNDASLRWVHSFGSWAIKPNVDYKSELAVSLPGDALGKGFFDFRQVDAGIEAEWKGETVKSARETFSAGRIQYYHYRFGIGVSPLFGEELHTDNRNLDFSSYNDTLAIDLVPWEDGLVSASLGGSLADYAHQRRLDPDSANGSVLSTVDRRDWMGTALLGLTQRWSGELGGLPAEGSAGVTGGYVVLSSNQNNFDLNQSFSTAFQFNPNYYSYHEYAIGPLLSLTLDRRYTATFAYNYTRRQYVDRPVQDSTGAYLAGHVRTSAHSASYGLSYQATKRLSARAMGGYVYSTSNSHFESFYLYNYSYPYYFVGFGWSL